MKRKIVIVPLVLLLLLTGVFLAGPRVAVDTAVAAPALPADLDGYLAAQEAQFDDIVPGTEKSIIWAGEPGVPTPYAVIYLHGFSASRQEAAPLADDVAAALGANLYYARFAGHGRSGEALAEATVNDWLNDATEALAIGRRLGEQVVVIGVSTGATAAAWLATQPEADDVAAFVWISPNFGPADPTSEILTWPWAEQIATALIGTERSWEPDNELHALYWTEQYPTRAILPMMGLVKLARSGPLEEIDRPVLVIYSPADMVINPERVVEAYGRVGSEVKALVPIDDPADSSNHVLAGDILAPEDTVAVARLIIDFVAAP